MQLKRNQRPMPKLIIIPLVDVMVFLLVFFMASLLPEVTAQGLNLTLPTSQSTDTVPAQKVVVTLSGNGQIFVDRDAVTADKVAATVQATGKDTVVLRADKTVPYGQVMAVMDGLKSAGISHVTVATKTN
ncbi:MAG: biopolymer transporter ExbD [Veillonella sp.]|nr:biopolymer transporter ExbD [Veillonella sp.]MBP9624513.1 biopolymer transporter ExbD [Veillonella sp.]